jgi:hypothetical protein
VSLRGCCSRSTPTREEAIRAPQRVPDRLQRDGEIKIE